MEVVWAVPTVAVEEWEAAVACVKAPLVAYRDEVEDDQALIVTVIEVDQEDPEVVLHRDVRLTNYSHHGLLSYYS